MKKWILLHILMFCSILNIEAIDLEKWTYDSMSFRPLGNALSIPTGSSFGNLTDPYLSEYLDGTALIANLGAPPASYSQGISAPSYAGSTSGAYTISFDITTAGFPATGTGKAQFGWGLRSNISGQDDCNVLFRYDNGKFQLVANDESGINLPVTISTGSTLSNLFISMSFNLDAKGTPGSFSAYYQLGGGPIMPIHANQLTLHNDFQIDQFVMQFDMTSPGFAWGANDYAFFDNLTFETTSLAITLTNTGHSVSFTANNGLIPDTPTVTYEPGDVLEIITTNLNYSVVSAYNVTTSLSANPSAFTITPIPPTTFASLAPNETYTATYSVVVLPGAADGPHTFTVINQIGAGPDAIVFRDEIK